MIDMSKTVAPKSDQLNADDLIAGAKTITITDIKSTQSPDQPISIYFDGDNGKPYKPCKSMRRVLIFVWGNDGKQYIGKSLTIFNDPKVRFGGTDVGGIRISHMSDIEKPVTMALTVTKANRKPYTVYPLVLHKNDLFSDGMIFANKGIDALKMWWDSLSKEDKNSIKGRMEELKKIAENIQIETTEESETNNESGNENVQEMP